MNINAARIVKMFHCCTDKEKVKKKLSFKIHLVKNRGI